MQFSTQIATPFGMLLLPIGEIPGTNRTHLGTAANFLNCAAAVGFIFLCSIEDKKPAACVFRTNCQLFCRLCLSKEHLLRQVDEAEPLHFTAVYCTKA